LPTVAEAVEATVAGQTLYAKVDLTDAYWQGRLAPAMWPMMGVIVPSGRVYGMRVLPMGSSQSPRLFQHMLAPVVASIQKSMALRCLGYLDDLLLVCKDQGEASGNWPLIRACQLLTSLGVTLSVAKTSQALAPTVTWLGMELDARAACVTAPAAKWQAFKKAARSMERAVTRGAAVQARSVAQLIGRLRSLRPAVEAAHYLSTSLVEWLRVLARGAPSWDASRPMSWAALPLTGPMPTPTVELRAALLDDLSRWSRLPAAMRSCPMARVWQSPTLLSVATDASSEQGFGATLLVQWAAVSRLLPPPEIEASGAATLSVRWSPSEMKLHINAKEALAVAHATRWATAWWAAWSQSAPLRAWLGRSRCVELAALLARSTLEVRSDSVTTVATVNTLRPRSLALAGAVSELHQALLAPAAPARIRAVHVAGVSNVEPDRLSRARVATASDWAVPSVVYRQACATAGLVPQTDLCATARTAKCPWFVGFGSSRSPAQISVDVLVTNWPSLPQPLYLAPGAATAFVMPVLHRLALFLPSLTAPILIIMPGWEAAWRPLMRRTATQAAKAMWMEMTAPLPGARDQRELPWVACALWPPRCVQQPAGRRRASTRGVTFGL
jgi:hypothetical protein